MHKVETAFAARYNWIHFFFKPKKRTVKAGFLSVRTGLCNAPSTCSCGGNKPSVLILSKYIMFKCLSECMNVGFGAVKELTRNGYQTTETW